MNYTISSITEADDVVRLGDVAYLSNRQLAPARLAQIGKWLRKQDWVQEILKRKGFNWDTDYSWHITIMVLDILLQERSFSPSQQIPEPSWMLKLPRDARRYIRRGYAMSEGLDPLGIVPQFPYTGFGYIICDYGSHGYSLASEACQVFRLHRLSNVKQLSFIHDPVLRDSNRGNAAMMFEHSRYCHSLDTSAVANILAENNREALESYARSSGLSADISIFNTFNAAAIAHDALTPAGGDSTKLIDPEAFDEETHFPELCQGEKWEDFQKKWKVDKDLLTATVAGQGLLGSLLDIADKSSYMARDANAYLGRPPSKDWSMDAKYFGTIFYSIADLLNHNPHICALWEVTKVINGEVVIISPERLEKFLILRALLFRGLYYNWASRFFEYLVGKGVVKYLYQKKKLTRKELLEHGDQWLEEKIGEVFGVPYVLRLFHNLDNCRIEEHQDLKAACSRAAEFNNNLDVFVIVDDFQSKTSSGTSKFLVRKGRKIMPFYDACPKGTEEIERIMKFEDTVRLYFFSMDDLMIAPHKRRKIKKIFQSVQVAPA